MIHNWYENMLYYMIKSIFGEYLAALERKKAKKLMSFSKSNVKHIAVKRKKKKTQQRLWCPQKMKEKTTKASANTAKEVIKLVALSNRKNPTSNKPRKRNTQTIDKRNCPLEALFMGIKLLKKSSKKINSLRKKFELIREIQ